MESKRLARREEEEEEKNARRMEVWGRKEGRKKNQPKHTNKIHMKSNFQPNSICSFMLCKIMAYFPIIIPNVADIFAIFPIFSLFHLHLIYRLLIFALDNTLITNIWSCVPVCQCVCVRSVLHYNRFVSLFNFAADNSERQSHRASSVQRQKLWLC